MNSSRRLIVMCLAPAVVGLGLTACAQSTSPPPTPARTTTPVPESQTTPATTPTTTPTTTITRTVPPGPVGVSTPAVPGGGPSPSCVSEQRWGTGPRSGSSAMSPSALYLTRVGRHACYDRVVFDINGSQAVGFVVRYVPVVLADASGQPIPVPGRAALQVVVRAPILGADNQGHQPWRTTPSVGESLVAHSQISGLSSVRAVTFAGSFEGQTTIAVGVRERLPFRVLVTSGQGYRHVVLDIAH